MRMGFVFAVFLCCWPFVVAAQTPLAVDLADNHIDITTGFDGSHLVLYGVKDKAGDVAVVLRGAEKDVVVRRKRQLFGAWINRGSVKFEDVPQLYDVALSGNELDLLSVETLKEEGIGFAFLKFDPAREGMSESETKIFQDALIRNKQAGSLFPKDPKAVKMISDRFFKVEFYIPANVPTGDYTVETYLIEDQKIIDKRLMNVRVAQVGFGAMIYKFAHSYYFAYSLLTILIAVFAGWLSNAVRLKT